jgi:hypothetical protein
MHQKVAKLQSPFGEGGIENEGALQGADGPIHCSCSTKPTVMAQGLV